MKKKVRKQDLRLFIQRLSEIPDVNEQSTNLFKFYYTDNEIIDFPPITSIPPATAESGYLKDMIKADRQEYIQDVIFGLENILKKGYRDESNKKRRKAVKNAIYVFQKLNDMSLWDRFQRIFFTGETDNLGNIPEKNSYKKTTEISVTSVPNITVLRKLKDGMMTNELEEEPLTNTIIQSREIFENPIDKINHAMYTADERFNLWSILANMTPGNKDILNKLNKKRKTRKQKFITQYPHFYDKDRLDEYKDNVKMTNIVGGKINNNHKTRKNRKM